MVGSNKSCQPKGSIVTRKNKAAWGWGQGKKKGENPPLLEGRMYYSVDDKACCDGL